MTAPKYLTAFFRNSSGSCLPLSSCSFFLMYLFGFYIASIVYIFICLRFFRIKMKYIFLVLICMAALIYGTFDVFLNVPLPDGIIMEEFL